MAGPGGGSGSNVSVLLQNQPVDSFFLSGSSPSFLGSRSMVSFGDVNHGNGSSRSFFCSFDHDDNAVEDDLDEFLHQPGKKRRLTVDQVQFLERSFEVENKLEPERKLKLAKDVGLQPRQVAIWFQNRRARWKTKQMEKDYEVLLASYDTLKADYDGLLAEKERLKSEVDLLKNKLEAKSNDSSDLSDTERNTTELPKTSTVDSGSEGEVSKASIGASKQEDISSAKSDIFDSDSPHYPCRISSSLLETGDSSYVFEHDQSDLSQDEDDNLSMNLLHTPGIFPKLEHSEEYSKTSASFEDDAFWSWSY